MDALVNATTGFLQWAPPPENDSLISSLTYLTLTIGPRTHIKIMVKAQLILDYLRVNNGQMSMKSTKV